jgi:hypothetical protein
MRIQNINHAASNPMNRFLRVSAVSLLACGALIARAADASKPPGYVNFGEFTPPADGGQFVEVNVQSRLINLAARLADAHEPRVAELIRGINSVRINVIGLNDANREELTKRIHKLRNEMTAEGWENVVTVQDRKDSVGVYLKHGKADAIEGVFVTVLDGGGEAVFVNVVGNINPENLVELGEHLNLLPLKKVGEVIKPKSKS